MSLTLRLLGIEPINVYVAQAQHLRHCHHPTAAGAAPAGQEQGAGHPSQGAQMVGSTIALLWLHLVQLQLLRIPAPVHGEQGPAPSGVWGPPFVAKLAQQAPTSFRLQLVASVGQAAEFEPSTCQTSSHPDAFVVTQPR